MKKWIALIVAIIMCLTFCACGDNEGGDKISKEPTENGSIDNNGDADNMAGSTTDADWLIDGWIINAVKIRNDVQIVELTTENWMEHFKVYHCAYRYEEVKEEKDTFGDVVSSETITHEYDGYAFGAGNDKYHWYSSVAIELKDKTSGELMIYEFGQDDIFLEETFDINNYECSRIKGSIYYWDYPIGTIPVGVIFSPFEGSVDGMPYPVGWEVCRGTNAIRYTEMGWII